MNLDLDPLIHQPIRTKIMAYLCDAKEADFTTLKKSLDVTDGHMTTHMKPLIEAGYVSMRKEFLENKPRTTYSITRTGSDAFSRYVKTLRHLLNPGGKK